MTTLPNLTEIPAAELAALCRRWHIRRLSLFGSALREDFRPDSDLDVVVEFEPGARIGWEFVALADELSALFGREVDLNTPDMLSRYFRERVLSSMRVVYERAG
ncbi:MAG: nucleotidyltransferase family protein [Anaerolineae bacterium]|nr:nucleotidyltransferase family protein [Anaerolineae bacterium]